MRPLYKALLGAIVVFAGGVVLDRLNAPWFAMPIFVGIVILAVSALPNTLDADS
jgi:ABC-type branched-subunit amino acid transport system permease subunit